MEPGLSGLTQEWKVVHWERAGGATTAMCDVYGT